MIQVDGRGVASPVPNKQRLQLWVDALRGGQFQQATGVLRQPVELNEDGSPKAYGYCCLGVACEVAVANGLELDLGPYFNNAASDENLPDEVRDWYGLPSESGDVFLGEYPEWDPLQDIEGGPLERLSAVEANDDRMWGFDRIADALEAQYLRDTDA